MWRLASPSLQPAFPEEKGWASLCAQFIPHIPHVDTALQAFECPSSVPVCSLRLVSRLRITFAKLQPHPSPTSQRSSASPPPLAYLPSGPSLQLLPSRHQVLPNVFLLLSPECSLLCPSLPSQLPSAASIFFLRWIEFLPPSEKPARILYPLHYHSVSFFLHSRDFERVMHSCPSFPHLP